MHGRFQGAGGGDGRGFGQAPGVEELDSELVETAEHGLGRGGAANGDAQFIGEAPAAGVVVDGVQQGLQDGGHRGGERDLLLLDEVEQGGGLQVAAGEDELASVHDGGEREPHALTWNMDEMGSTVALRLKLS